MVSSLRFSGFLLDFGFFGDFLIFDFHDSSEDNYNSFFWKTVKLYSSEAELFISEEKYKDFHIARILR